MVNPCLNDDVSHEPWDTCDIVINLDTNRIVLGDRSGDAIRERALMLHRRAGTQQVLGNSSTDAFGAAQNRVPDSM